MSDRVSILEIPGDLFDEFIPDNGVIRLSPAACEALSVTLAEQGYQSGLEINRMSRPIEDRVREMISTSES